MQVFKVFTVAILAITLCAGAINAKPLRNAGHPAEFPPSSFKGKQFVDSKGCIFIRTGSGGNVNWVPRVTRQRNQICGQQPTFAKSVAPKTPVAATSRPVSKPAPARAVRKVAARPAAAPKPVVKRAVRKAVPTVMAAPKRVATKPAVKRVTTQRSTAICQGGLAINHGGHTVRCGPQTQPLARGGVHSGAQTGGRQAGQTQTRKFVTTKPTRAVAPATAKQRKTSAPQRVVRRATVNKPPAGYRTAWDDGRLNPNRAKGTAQGRARMETVWTDTVPRRPVAVSASQDTRSRVILRKNASGQKATLASVSTKTNPGVRNTVSAASHRYVQVGTYGNPSNASKVIARLQGLGLPVRVTQAKSGGRVLQTVMAGPFTRQANLNAALTAARNAGYRDAILRR